LVVAIVKVAIQNFESSMFASPAGYQYRAQN
jgi:hypothetical protein